MSETQNLTKVYAAGLDRPTSGRALIGGLEHLLASAYVTFVAAMPEAAAPDRCGRR